MATKKTQAKSKGSPFIGLVIVGVLGLGSLAAYVKYGGADKVPVEIRKVPSLQQPANKDEGKTQTKVELVTPTREGMDLKLGKHESDVPAGEDPRLFAINHFLREAGFVPEEAKAVGIDIRDHVAYVDVTKAFNQTYGTMEEETLLKGLSATLAQFKDIDKVQFLLEGKPIETFGNVDLTEPLSVRPANSSDPPAK